MVKLLMHYIEKYGDNRTPSSDNETICLAQSVIDEISILDIFYTSARKWKSSLLL